MKYRKKGNTEKKSQTNSNFEKQANLHGPTIT